MQFPTALTDVFDPVTVPDGHDRVALAVVATRDDPAPIDTEATSVLLAKVAQAFEDAGYTRPDIHLGIDAADIATSPLRSGDDYDPVP